MQTHHNPRRARALAAAIMGVFAAHGLTGWSAILPVASCDDDGSPGTLRSVIGGAGSNDLVDLTQLTCSTISLADEVGSLYIGVDNLVIRARDTHPLHIAAPFHDRAVLHAGVGTLSLIGLNISGGTYAEPGGCVRSNGSVYLSASTVSGCQGGDMGGGIYAKFDLKLVGSNIVGNVVDAHTVSRGGGVFVGRDLQSIQSTISGNLATSYAGVRGAGGGAYVDRDASIVRSTISSNTANIGGGLAAVAIGRSFYLGESTVSGNTAVGAAGILFGPSKLLIYNSTIAFNQAIAANPSNICRNSAVCAYVPPLGPAPLLVSTIIADNTNASSGVNADLYSFQQPSGHKNLIVAANLTPPGTLVADPQLGPLSDNGGTTFTHALAASSPAVDAGDSDAWAVDQRGKPRVFGAAADIGAYELQKDAIFANGFQ